MQTRIGVTILAALCVLAVSPALDAGDQISATYRGLQPVVKFDISPPLRDIPPLPVTAGGEAMVDPEGPPGELGPQDIDPLVQGWTGGPELIPAPLLSFDGPSNLASVSPPDPVGDVGPNHYVAMSNLYFQIYDKAGTSLYGPAANNTLWSGFGGDCQTDNAGDPIVLYDQIADRWMLTQFTSSGPTYFNCVAVSTTPDPTGSYYRWAVSTGANFPDYPKYGVWPDAYYISTREFAGGSTFAGVGAYALERADLISGNPALTVISFLATPAGSGGAYNVGDGLLPSDLDGSIPPPAGSPNYFVGAMDNGATYGAPQDALTLWKFDADFVTPANSTFILTNTIPITAYDTIPVFCSGRSCVPQPGTSNRIDHLGYRQRPMHRLAYRNFGSHEALVTNQSIEASATMSGIRWWEIRSPNSAPFIYQEGTYAPGVSDGVHRWMGSIARTAPATWRSATASRTAPAPSRARALHRPAVGRPARHPAPGRGVDDHRHRVADRQPALGRLHLDERRPDRRLHLLVRQPVHRRSRAASAGDCASAPSSSTSAARRTSTSRRSLMRSRSAPVLPPPTTSPSARSPASPTR